MPIYYVRHVLAGVEAKYSPLETHIFNLVISAHKLKSYLQSYPITLLTNMSLIARRKIATGSLAFGGTGTSMLTNTLFIKRSFDIVNICKLH